MGFADFVMRLGFTLLETAQGLFDFLAKEYTILLWTFSVYEMLFGGALFIILGWVLVSWITNIVS